MDEAKDAQVKANPLPVKYARSPGVYKEWIGACKGGSPSLSTFSGHAAGLTEMVLLGCLAVRLGQRIEVDPATGMITKGAIPPEWIKPNFRAGWTL